MIQHAVSPPTESKLTLSCPKRGCKTLTNVKTHRELCDPPGFHQQSDGCAHGCFPTGTAAVLRRSRPERSQSDRYPTTCWGFSKLGNRFAQPSHKDKKKKKKQKWFPLISLLNRSKRHPKTPRDKSKRPHPYCSGSAAGSLVFFGWRTSTEHRHPQERCHGFPVARVTGQLGHVPMANASIGLAQSNKRCPTLRCQHVAHGSVLGPSLFHESEKLTCLPQLSE